MLNFFSPDADIAHAGNGLKSLLENIVGDLCQFKQITLIALYGHRNDRTAVSIALRYDGWIHIRRQIAQAAAHPVAHVVGCGLQVNVQFEFHGDGASAIGTHTCKVADAGDAVDLLFEYLSDLALHDIGVRTHVVGSDGDHRRINARVFAHA